jgi:predicted metal-dependent hydrolase
MSILPFQFELPLPRKRDLTAREQTCINGAVVPYTLRRSTRRRSISLRIDEDGLRVSVPWNASQHAIRSALEHHADWVTRKLGEWQTRRPPAVTWANGDSLMYLGSPLKLVVDASRGTTRLAPEGLVVHAPAAHPDLVAQKVAAWMKEQAALHYPGRVEHYCGLLGVSVSDVKLSSARSRWGSCHSNGCIRLNWRMIQTPARLIDYVVAHEVAHLREMNHSARFWQAVGTLVPDYAERRAEIRRNGHRYLIA